MSQFETIGWRDLPGNKYVKALEAAMLSEQGCIAMQKVRHCSEPKGRMCNVIYDREYVVQFLIKRVVFALAGVGNKAIHELIDDAWDELHGLADNPSQVSDIAS